VNYLIEFPLIINAIMRIAIYSRGLEADQQEGPKLLLAELDRYKN